MKLFKYMAYTALAVVSGLGINSCADLNYGLDTNSAYPYWYGSGGLPGIGWNGPWYNAPTPLPVYWPDYGPGPIVRPPTNKPPVNTPSRPSVPTVTVGPNGIERPGNMGRPTPGAGSSNDSKGLNLNRGR